MRRARLLPSLFALLLASAANAAAQPTFVNGLVVPGNTLDATREPGANAGRFGHFSDLYYDPVRHEWWALSDRGPGGGLLDYGTRVQRIDLDVHPFTGRISNFKIKETVRLRDRSGNLLPPGVVVNDEKALNGLNPQLLNGNAAVLGRSFDPEGLAIDPRTGRFLIADEYGPSVYEFSRSGRLVGVFEVPPNLVPMPAWSPRLRRGARWRFVGLGAAGQPRLRGPRDQPGRQAAVRRCLQDPLLDEGPRSNSSDATDNDGRDGRNLRIIVFDNDWWSRTYRQSIAQYVYQLEPQALVRARIVADGGTRIGYRPTAGAQPRRVGDRRPERSRVPGPRAGQSRDWCGQSGGQRPGRRARSRRSASSAASASTRST